MTIVGVAIYIVTQLSKDKKSCKEIAAVVNLSEQTIRNGYADVYDYRHQLILKGWKLNAPIESLSMP